MSVAPPLVIAHRGGSAAEPENSMAAFREAIGRGARAVEFDVHLTSDGEPVVIHDPTLDRTTTGRGQVYAHAWSDVSRLRLWGTDEHVPHLAEALAFLAPAGVDVLVEIKSRADGTAYPEIVAVLLDHLRRAAVCERCMVSAFDWETLAELRATSPATRAVGVITARDTCNPEAFARCLRKLVAIGAESLGVEHGAVNPELVRRVRAVNLDVGAWTVNDAEEMRRLAFCGVRWIISDTPCLALQAFPDRVHEPIELSRSGPSDRRDTFSWRTPR